MRVPSESVANDFRPRSMPVSCPVGRQRLYRHIGARETDIPAVRFSEIVTVLGVPAIRRDQRTAMRPILERTRIPLSRVAPLPNSL